MLQQALLIALTSSAVFAADATPTLNQCNAGDLQCCNNVQDAHDPAAAALLGLVGVVLGDITGQVGLGCTPVSVIGVDSGVDCAQMPVCCTDNTFQGLVNIGCTPIDI